MNNPLDEIKRFQTDRNLEKMVYNPMNEHVSIVEELLESIGLDVPKANRPALKANLEVFIDSMVKGGIAVKPTLEHTKEDTVDAYADIIVFAVGALMKLGYEPNAVLGEVAKEINSRVGSMVDGKFEKDLSEEAQASWYKADYTTCLLPTEEV